MNDKNKKYRYIGTSTNPKDFTFDDSHFQKLIDDREFQAAYDYGMQYSFDNHEKQREYEHYLKTILRDGRKIEAVYRNIDEIYYPIIDFKNAVTTSGGLEKLSSDNEYANKFIEYKKSLGSGENRLSVKFEPQVQKLWGIDFLKRDNTEASIEKFYKDTGFNKQMLEANGVSVRLKNGCTYLEFDKSNDLANQILLNVNDDVSVHYSTIRGIYEDGTYTDDDQHSTISYSDAYRPLYRPSNLKLMQDLYKSAVNLEKEAYNTASAPIKQYSSTYVPLFAEDIQELNKQLNNGAITQSEYNARRKAAENSIINGMQNIGVGQYDIYTTYFNKDDAPVNEIVTQEQEEAILKRFNSTTRSQIRYGISVVDGKIGLTIDLMGNTSKKGVFDVNRKNDIQESDPIRFTIFGDDIQQQLQKEIDNDPKLQAYQELNDMQTLGYTYKDGLGNTYTYNGLDGWIVNGTQSDKSNDWIVKQIHKDKSSESIGRELALNHRSVNGKLVNKDQYGLDAMTAAIVMVKDLNPDIDILETLKVLYGDSLNYNNYTDIALGVFSLMSMSGTVAQEYEDSIANPDVYNAFNDIFDIYKNIIKVGKRFIVEY